MTNNEAVALRNERTIQPCFVGGTAMKSLRPVITVREIPPACSQARADLPSLQTYVSSTPSHGEALVLEYLCQGVICGIYNDRGMQYDVLESGRRIEPFRRVGKTEDNNVIQPNLILTDGTWVWPGALPYYVAIYHLQLPTEFLHHAERQNWHIDPASVPVEELNWDAFDSVAVASVV